MSFLIAQVEASSHSPQHTASHSKVCPIFNPYLTARPHSKKLKRAKRQIAVSSAQRTQSLKKKLSSFQHQQHVHTGGGGGGGDKPVNSGSMDTRETATDGISSTTTTGSEAMITDEGSRTDRYTLLLLMKGIKYWLAININDGYLSLSVCHTLIILIIIIGAKPLYTESVCLFVVRRP